MALGTLLVGARSLDLKGRAAGPADPNLNPIRDLQQLRVQGLAVRTQYGQTMWPGSDRVDDGSPTDDILPDPIQGHAACALRHHHDPREGLGWAGQEEHEEEEQASAQQGWPLSRELRVHA